MSARDLARFAVLYLHKGNWAGHQIVPRDWVEESTHAYSKSAFGPGYGYLWWTDFVDDVLAPVVHLPEGSFFALGDGGQYAMVVPALDLVVVQRGDRDINKVGPSMHDVGRLLWLVLKAEGYDPGGPCTLRFEPDDQITYLHWGPRCGPSPGRWMVAEDQFCIEGVERRCFIPVVNGNRIELFDRYGAMQIDAVAIPR